MECSIFDWGVPHFTQKQTHTELKCFDICLCFRDFFLSLRLLLQLLQLLLIWNSNPSLYIILSLLTAVYLVKTITTKTRYMDSMGILRIFTIQFNWECTSEKIPECIAHSSGKKSHELELNLLNSVTNWSFSAQNVSWMWHYVLLHIE